jgi:hypothetical protein
MADQDQKTVKAKSGHKDLSRFLAMKDPLKQYHALREAEMHGLKRASGPE